MGHEHERLSAYLDDELPSAERAQVAAHVQACPECAERLAALGAVDDALAALPAEAPAGYFESLPGRVRARLDARPKRTGLPAWTWAVAAVLALAVVTPLTLRQQPQPDTAAPAPALPPVPSPAAPPTTLSAMRDEQKMQGVREKDKAPAQNRYNEPLKREGGFTPAPADRDARLDALGYVSSAAPPPAAPGAASERRHQSTTAPQPSLQAEAAPPPRAREEEAAEAVTVSEAAPDAFRQQPGAAAAPKPDPVTTGISSAGVGGRGRVASRTPPGTTEAKLRELEPEWQRLEARRPRTPVEWRRLREDWRSFVARDPEGPLANPARLRMIEAGRAAWRASQDTADEATFREDAEAYLARDAAPQKDRVRSLLIDSGVR